MRRDDLARDVFTDDPAPGGARLVGDALARLDAAPAGWLAVSEAPPPPEVLERALSRAAPARQRPVLRGLWMFGVPALAAACLAAVLMVRAVEPDSAGPAATIAAGMPRASSGGAFVSASTGATADGVLEIVRATPRLVAAIKAQAAGPSAATRAEVLAALRQAGMPSGDGFVAGDVRIDGALAARLDGSMPAEVRLRRFSDGSIHILE